MSDRSTPVAWVWRQDRPPRWLSRAALTVAVTFLAVGLVWGMVADGYRPDRFDVIGATVCLLGVAVIMYAPRPA